MTGNFPHACVICRTPFLVERDHHRMGLCDECARKAGASYVYAHSGMHDPHLDPENHAIQQDRARRAREGKYQKKAVSAATRLAIFKRDGYRCVKCGSQDSLEVDHIHPERLGGTSVKENLRTLCKSCNGRKKDRPEVAA